MYDLIIIGTGPAGFTAGIYAVRREMKTLIIGQEMGGQMIWAHEIENYPGFTNINNFELINYFKEHALKSGVEIKEKEVKKIEKSSNFFILHTDKEKYQAKSVILALGLSPKRMSIPGEAEFNNGRGVSYCANCDGPFYRGKTIAVIGGGNSAFDAAEVMSKIAKKVYLINRSENFKAFESLIKKVKSKDNVEIIINAESREIKGQEKVESFVYYDKNSSQNEALDVDGIFVEIGRIAKTGLADELIDKDDYGQILVDKNQATKTPGLFAAGDVVSGQFKQITVASGQGTVAALAAYQYLQQLEN